MYVVCIISVNYNMPLNGVEQHEFNVLSHMLKNTDRDMTAVEDARYHVLKKNLKILLVVAPKPPKSVPPPAAFGHPRLAKPAPLAVGKCYFFLKNPNFGFGLAGAAASAAIHSCSTAASHVI